MSPRKQREVEATFPPFTICRCCSGTGRVELSEELNETLCALRKRGRATAADLQPGVSVREITKVHNRLSSLAKLGFARRVGKAGRCWYWEVTGKGGGA